MYMELNLLQRNSIIRQLKWQIIKLNPMVVCYNTHTITLTQKYCKTYRQLIQTAAKMINQPQDMLKVYFVAANSSETHIQSDADLLALRYFAKKGQLCFKIISSKTKEQIEAELIQDQVSNFLQLTYENIAEEQIKRELNQELDDYFQQLYQKIIVKQAKQRLKRIEQEEVAKYMNKLKRGNNGKIVSKRRPSVDSKVKQVKYNPENELFKRKQGKVQLMVKRILESMMPVMVKELSYRIIEDLKQSQSIETAHTLHQIDEQQSIEYL